MSKKVSRSARVVERRKAVKSRLEQQLKDGTKLKKFDTIPLSEKDISRIENEIAILSERL